MQLISQRTYDLKNKLFVGYSSHDLKKEPFNYHNIFGPFKYHTYLLFWPPLYSEGSNTEQVRYSDGPKSFGSVPTIRKPNKG